MSKVVQGCWSVCPPCALRASAVEKKSSGLKKAWFFRTLTEMNAFWILALLLIGITGGACHKAAELSVSTPVDPGEPTQAQPKLQTLKLWIGSQEMMAEVALTPQQQRTGMMFRTEMGPNDGMLFIMPQPQQASFWMKNCPLPLSIAYIDSEGVIREIHELQPHNTNAVLSASNEIRFALETPQGWFERHQIRPGVVVATDRGPLLQSFFGRR